MNVPKIFDVNTHRSLVRFLIKFVKEFNDLVETVDVLTKRVDGQERAILNEMVKLDLLSGKPDLQAKPVKKAKKAKVTKNEKK